MKMPVAYLFFFPELKILSNSETRVVGDVLFITWEVPTQLPGNLSNSIQFEVNYCPLDHFLDTQDCKDVNVSLCSAVFAGQPSIAASISTHERVLASYLSFTGANDFLFVKNRSTSISSKVNKTNGRFVCAIHNVDECWVAFPSWWSSQAVKGQVLITATMAAHKKNFWFKILQNQGLLLTINL